MDTYIPSLAKRNSTAPWLNTPQVASGTSKVGDFEIPDLPGVVQRQRQMSTGLLGGQDTLMSDWLSKYNTALQGQENIGAMYNRLGTELGIPGLRQNAFDLQAGLEAIPQVQQDASRNFNVNANQLARMTQTKQAQMAPLAQKATSQYQFAQGQLGEMMPQYLAQQNKEMDPYQKELSYINDRNARETTLFSQDNQRELDAYIAKMNTGAQLTSQELQRAHELAMQEKAYQNARGLAEQQFGYNKELQNMKTSATSFDWGSYGL